MKFATEEEAQHEIGEHQAQQRGQQQVAQKADEGRVQAAVQGDEQVLRIAYGAGDAAYGHRKGQGEQQQLGREPVFAREQQHQRRADHGQGIVHEQRRAQAGGQQQAEYQRIRGTGTLQETVGRVEQQSAAFEGIADDEGPEQKAHHVPVDGGEGTSGRDVPGEQHGCRAQAHGGPDGHVETPQPPHGDEQEHHDQGNDGEGHGKGACCQAGGVYARAWRETTEAMATTGKSLSRCAQHLCDFPWSNAPYGI